MATPQVLDSLRACVEADYSGWFNRLGYGPLAGWAYLLDHSSREEIEAMLREAGFRLSDLRTLFALHLEAGRGTVTRRVIQGRELAGRYTLYPHTSITALHMRTVGGFL